MRTLPHRFPYHAPAEPHFRWVIKGVEPAETNGVKWYLLNMWQLIRYLNYKETASDLFGLRIKLPPVTKLTSLTDHLKVPTGLIDHSKYLKSLDCILSPTKGGRSSPLPRGGGLVLRAGIWMTFDLPGRLSPKCHAL